MNTDQTKYVPGVCNINHAEIAYRRKAGYFGLATFAVLLLLLLSYGSNALLRIILFIPAFIAAISYLQVKNKFCVKYGASGQQNAEEGSQAATSVTDKKAIVLDKIKANGMNLQAAVIALGVTLFAYLI